MKLDDVARFLSNSKNLLKSYYQVENIYIGKSISGRTCNKVFVTFNVGKDLDMFQVDIVKYKGKTYMISSNIMKEVAMVNCLSSYKGSTSIITEEMVKYVAGRNNVNFAKGRFVTLPKNEHEVFAQLKHITAAYNEVRILYTESVKDASAFDRAVSKSVANELEIKRDKDRLIDFDELQGK